MRTQRPYTHRHCRTETIVSGPEFQAMSDPLLGMRTTYCSTCERQYPVTDFAWSDTNELISDYYDRHTAKATPEDLWWCQNGGLAFLALTGLIFGACAGIAIGFFSILIGVIVGVVLAIVGAIGGVVLREAAVRKSITRRVLAVEDTRLLS